MQNTILEFKIFVTYIFSSFDQGNMVFTIISCLSNMTNLMPYDQYLKKYKNIFCQRLCENQSKEDRKTVKFHQSFNVNIFEVIFNLKSLI